MHVRNSVRCCLCFAVALILAPLSLGAQESAEPSLAVPAEAAPAQPAPAEPAPTAEEPVEASDVIELEDPVTRAVAGVRAALAALTQAEDAVRTEGGMPTPFLRQARLDLEGALLALGAAQEQERLRGWLEEKLATPEPSPELDITPVAADDAVSDSTLAQVRAAIESAPFKDDKMQVLRTRLTGSRVSTGQVAELLDLFSLSSHRVDALVFLHPRITDPERFDSLLNTLKFESDRKTVLDRLGLGG